MNDGTVSHHDGQGWHPDPFGRHAQRWWDGARWTERVRSGEVPGIDPPGIDPQRRTPGATDRVGPLEPSAPVELRSPKLPQALLAGLLLLVAIVVLVVVGLVA